MTPKKCFTIGIAGGSASGKSTLAEQLAKKCEENKQCVHVLHMDRYFKEADKRPIGTGLTNGKTYIDDNHPQTMDLPQFFRDLKQAQSEDYDIIIAEGLLTLHDDAILSLLDLKLFVECRADERIVRRIKRNMQWGLTFEEITDVYLNLVRFRHDEYVESSKWRADFIWNGSTSSEIALDLLMQGVLRLERKG